MSSYIISTSYGNDSVAMIQWAIEQGLENVVAVYCDTGWAAPEWAERVEKCEAWINRLGLGYRAVRVHSMGMEQLVRDRKGFPANQYQFCTAHLKGIPFLTWADEFDPDCQAVCMVGKRRAESRARAETPEYVELSEPHGGRRLWHPLYAHTDAERDELLVRAGFEVLPHRSQECSPCVNANRQDFRLLTPQQIERVNSLEVEIGKPMFRPKRFGTLGIHGVVAWAIHGRKREHLDPEEMIEGSGCDGNYGCGL